MKDENKTKEQLIDEINEMRQKLRNAEASLLQSEDKFSKAFHFSPDTFVISNLSKHCFTEVNDTFLKATGYKREEVIGHSSDSLGIFAVPEAKDQIIKQVKEQGSIRNLQTSFRMKSGEIKTTLLSADIIELAGEPHLFCVTKNITELKRMAETIRFSEECYSKAFHHNPDIITISTLKEGRYFDFNNSFVERVGYERHEAIGRTAEELDVWVNSQQRDLMLKKIQENGIIRNFEVELRTKSGETRTCSLAAEIIDILGEAHIIITSRDITENKRMEKALHLSEERFSKAFNASPIIMTITGLEDGKYISANNAFRNIFGYGHEEAIGRTSLGMGWWADPADRELVKQNIMAEKPVRDMEIYFCTKTGEKRLGLYTAESLEV
ncbi:MAG: PAS domain S-box protein, partial [Chitinophagales bacterium]